MINILIKYYKIIYNHNMDILLINSLPIFINEKQKYNFVVLMIVYISILYKIIYNINYIFYSYTGIFI